MEQTLTLRFKLGPIPVVIEPWFWAVSLMMGANLRGPDVILWVLVVFVSIMVHELGHAMATRAFGGKAWIRLHSFGGLTYPDRKLPRWKDIAMSLAGPFAGFALAGVIFAVQWQMPWVALTPKLALVLGMAFSVNFWWGIMNLLPVPPLDGGHVALSLAGPRRERGVRILAAVVCGAVVVWALLRGSIYQAVLFGMLGFQNIQQLSGPRQREMV